MAVEDLAARARPRHGDGASRGRRPAGCSSTVLLDVDETKRFRFIQQEVRRPLFRVPVGILVCEPDRPDEAASEAPLDGQVGATVPGAARAAGSGPTGPMSTNSAESARRPRPGRRTRGWRAYDVMRSRRPWAATSRRPASVDDGVSLGGTTGRARRRRPRSGRRRRAAAVRPPIEWPSRTTGTSPSSARTSSSAHRASATGRAAVPAADGVAQQPDAGAAASCAARGDRRAGASASAPRGAAAVDRAVGALLAAVQQQHQRRAGGRVRRSRVRAGRRLIEVRAQRAARTVVRSRRACPDGCEAGCRSRHGKIAA